MMTRSCIGALLALAITIGLPSAALAIMDDERPPADDPDYAAGVAAFEREDWQSVIEIMERVVAQKPWHDDAHTRMGFAYRKQGDYERALRAYDKALALNPHHRGALEYLGEAYLEIGRPGDAEAMLARLATECRRVAADGDDWQADCEEWQDLRAALDAQPAAGKPAGATQ
jgi:tetratricopeptide (TPR) repeat protein